jgi:hypothetical protein
VYDLHDLLEHRLDAAEAAGLRLIGWVVRHGVCRKGRSGEVKGETAVCLKEFDCVDVDGRRKETVVPPGRGLSAPSCPARSAFSATH